MLSAHRECCEVSVGIAITRWVRKTKEVPHDLLRLDNVDDSRETVEVKFSSNVREKFRKPKMGVVQHTVHKRADSQINLRGGLLVGVVIILNDFFDLPCFDW